MTISVITVQIFLSIVLETDHWVDRGIEHSGILEPRHVGTTFAAVYEYEHFQDVYATRKSNQTSCLQFLQRYHPNYLVWEVVALEWYLMNVASSPKSTWSKKTSWPWFYPLHRHTKVYLPFEENRHRVIPGVTEWDMGPSRSSNC